MSKPINLEIVEHAKDYMQSNNIDAWLSYDFKGSNPLFWRIIGQRLSTSRRSFLFIPQNGQPKVLASVLDRRLFASLNWPVMEYSSRDDLEEKLTVLLRGCADVAMEYSPQANIPYIGRVDAGTIELVEEKGIRVISSGDLFQYAAARWSREELDEHLKAARNLTRIKDEAFEFARRKVISGRTITEFDIQNFILERFSEEQMVTEHKPIVAVKENSSDAHYEPTETDCENVEANDLLLLDICAKTNSPNGVYADITWMAYFGRDIPESYVEVFEVVREARDRVVTFLGKQLENQQSCSGFELDIVARDFITDKGFGAHFTHRTGHSLGTESVHGDSVHLDNYESKDTRSIIPGIGFTVEPGVYLKTWGIRSEINVYTSEKSPTITTPTQSEITRLV